MGFRRGKIAGTAIALCFLGLSPAEREEFCSSRGMYLDGRAGNADPSQDTSFLESGRRVARVQSHGAAVGLIDCENPANDAEYVTDHAHLSPTPVQPEAPEPPAVPVSDSSHQVGQSGQDCVTIDPGRFMGPGETPEAEPPVATAPTGAQHPAAEDRPVTPRPAAEAGDRPPARFVPPSMPPVAPSSSAERAESRRRLQRTGMIRSRVAPNAPLAPANIGTFQEAIEASDHARGAELVDTALDRLKAMRNAADTDRRTLTQFHRNATMESAVGLLDRARGKLERAASFLTEGEFAGAGAAETGRFRNYFLNARDRAETGARMLGEQLQKNAIEAHSPFLSILGRPQKTSRAAEALSEVFGAESGLSSETSQDALVNRMILFSALTEAEQREALEKLKLAETKKVALKNGQTVVLPLLHNGYFFGGGESSVDCSSFVSRVLPSEIRRGSFTTLDFRMMWLYSRSGHFEKPPLYREDRKKLVMRTAEAFVPIDLYLGERLQVGDLLVYRLPWKAAGHVFIVRDFDPKNLQAKVIEAAQSAGTIRERDFQLSVDPPGKRSRRVRPGLFALRLKPVSTEVCEYKGGRGGPRPGYRPGSRTKLGEGAAF